MDGKINDEKESDPSDGSHDPCVKRSQCFRPAWLVQGGERTGRDGKGGAMNGENKQEKDSKRI